MSIELYLAFIAAVVILMAIPGPNVALIVANSVAHGTRFGLLTVAATSSAVVVALLAGRLRALRVAHTRLHNRITGSLLVGAGVGLAMARRSS